MNKKFKTSETKLVIVSKVVQDEPLKARRSVIRVHDGALKKIIMMLETNVLTPLPFVHDGPLKARRSVMRVCRGTLSRNYKDPRNKGSDTVDGCAGWTVKGTTVHHNVLSQET